jgi:Fe-Mn family superoxide dismutase
MRTLAIILLLTSSFACTSQSQSKFSFPELPYSYDALESFIDKNTMEIHYSRHHRAYFNNFVKAAEELELEGMTLEEIFNQVSQYPTTVRNNGGGFYNHNLFWEVMSPNGGGEPSEKLMKAIEKSFGTFEEFQKKFQAAATGQFGSGWAWLSVDKNGNLFISSTPNQDNPLMDVVEKRGTPILGLDVWEHAYYLNYQNKRGDYAGNFWEVVSWEVVEQKYKEAKKN